MANNPVGFDAANPWVEDWETSGGAVVEPPASVMAIQMKDFIAGGNVIVPKHRTHERLYKFNADQAASIHNAQSVFLTEYMAWLRSQGG